MHSSATISRIAYDARRSFYQAQGQSEPEWMALEPFQRTAFQNQVRTTILNPQLFAQQLHGLFVRERSMAGWQFGPRFDLKQRRDPFLVVWSDLTVEQRMADEIVVAIVDVFRSRAVP